jgi:hypothetical protein
MEQVLFDRAIDIQFNQTPLRVNYFLRATFDVFGGQQNGLLGVVSLNYMILVFGVHTGTVNLKIVRTDEEPQLDAYWEEVVEASWTMPADSKLTVDDNFVNTFCAPVQLPAGTYRVRFCAKNFGVAEAWWAEGWGTGRGLDEYVGPTEQYELTFWPAPWAPDQVLKVKSPRAAGMHRWAQSLPKPA